MLLLGISRTLPVCPLRSSPRSGQHVSCLRPDQFAHINPQVSQCHCLESVHSFLHIMKLVSLIFLFSIPLALTASVSPSGSSLSASPPSPTSPQTQQDMDTVLQRRLDFITTSATMVSGIASWHAPLSHLPRTHLTGALGCKRWILMEAGLPQR